MRLIVILIFSALAAFSIAISLEMDVNANEPAITQFELLEQSNEILAAGNKCLNFLKCEQYCRSIGKVHGHCGGFLWLNCYCTD